jgi:hypothetical protein
MIEQGIPGLTLQETKVPQEDLPRVPAELLEWLEKRFPNSLPDLRISQLDYGVKHGQLEVVRLLREIHDRPSVIKEQS